MIMPPTLYYTGLLMGIALLANHWVFPYNLLAQPQDMALPDLNASNATVERHVVIRMESYSYTPSEVVLEAGQPVNFTLINESFLVPHNFLLDDPDGNRLVEADISSGDTHNVTLTLTEPGIYPFYCDKQFLFFPNHRKEGMEGRLIVR
jgi:plastocyanin